MRKVKLTYNGGKSLFRTYLYWYNNTEKIVELSKGNSLDVNFRTLHYLKEEHSGGSSFEITKMSKFQKVLFKLYKKYKFFDINIYKKGGERFSLTLIKVIGVAFISGFCWTAGSTFFQWVLKRI